MQLTPLVGLETYRQKRNFKLTAEPQGRRGRRKGHEFVVQKHAARRLHYDFRLELDGVLLSWAIPKGPSLDPGVKRLAMQTEDHPLEYGSFEGVIPKGEYGGGTVLLWDRGTWKPEGDAREMYRRGRLTFELKGEKLHGGYHLVRASGGNGDARRWLLIKRKDEGARRGSEAAIVEAQPRSVVSDRDLADITSDGDHVWTSRARSAGRAKRTAKPTGVRAGLVKRAEVRRAALPDFVEPELATLASAAPVGDAWLHEIKLDGYRILVRIEAGKVRLLSRRGHDWTERLPSVASALAALPVESVLLDGEVVVLGKDGVSDFQRLQNSLDADRDADCIYFAFDVLFIDGLDVRGLPLVERKALLKSTFEDYANERVRFGDHVPGAGPEVFERVCKLGLEGIISKRADSSYESGRGRAWLKVKCLARQEFVIGGFTEPAGSRKHLGALLLGVREGDQLLYAGKVGTGFTQSSLAELARRLRPLEQATAPFSNPPKGAERRGVHWVEPRLVAEVAFVERTEEGLVRHASFQGLREDKPAEDVRVERAEPKPSAPSGRAARSTRRSAKSGAPARARAARVAPKPEPKLELDPARLSITHPERILYPEQGLTKRDLLLYYARVAAWMLPHVASRPLMLVRCPEGAGATCFHQKHPSRGMPKAVEQVLVPEKRGQQANLMIRDVDGLLGLVQMGALEIHTWGCRAGAIEFPDQLVFDLDPDEGLPWRRVTEAATTLQAQLERYGLTGFLKTTGGKGLHIVVPVEPTTPWVEAKAFAKRVADDMVQAEPSTYLATMTKAKRKGKLFIDYFRNGLGATSICVFSTRARPGAPIALPISWDELERDVRGEHFRVQNIDRRLASLSGDPWEGLDAARSPIPKSR